MGRQNGCKDQQDRTGLASYYFSVIMSAIRAGRKGRTDWAALSFRLTFIHAGRLDNKLKMR